MNTQEKSYQSLIEDEKLASTKDLFTMEEIQPNQNKIKDWCAIKDSNNKYHLYKIESLFIWFDQKGCYHDPRTKTMINLESIFLLTK